jgi:serine/threonine protein kinase
MKMLTPERISFRLPQSLHLDGLDIYIKEEIGSGGFGSVYLAEHEGALYAVKLYRMWEVLPAEREDVLKRIYQEYKISETIDSPYVVKIFGYQEIYSNPLLIMEYCEGGSLRDLIGKSLDDEEILNIAEDICKGLLAMHEKEIVHRDIKPENILFTGQNYVLTDFGISASLHKRLTQTDITGRVRQIFATAAYSPPEQVDGNMAYKNIGPTNDIYAFGVVLYELLTQGHLPFGSFEQYTSAPLKYEEKKKLEEWDYTRLIQANPKAFWKNIIVQCLKPKAQDRFQDAGQILELLKSSNFSAKKSLPKSVEAPKHKITPQSKEVPPALFNKPNAWKLSVISEQQKETCFHVSKLSQGKNKSKLTIGRLDTDNTEHNDICIHENEEASVSRYHATLEKYMDEKGREQWFIRDGQWYKSNGIVDWYLSINGVYVNDRKVGKYGVALHDGDIVTLGNVNLLFQEA